MYRELTGQWKYANLGASVVYLIHLKVRKGVFTVYINIPLITFVIPFILFSFYSQTSCPTQVQVLLSIIVTPNHCYSNNYNCYCYLSEQNSHSHTKFFKEGNVHEVSLLKFLIFLKFLSGGIGPSAAVTSVIFQWNASITATSPSHNASLWDVCSTYTAEN